jgi:hypothetical protein
MGIYTNKYIPGVAKLVKPNHNKAGFEIRTQDDIGTITFEKDEFIFSINDIPVVTITSSGLDVGSIPGDMQKSVYDPDNDGIVELADTATTASQITGVQTAGNSKYYGTNDSGIVGFHDIEALTVTGVSTVFGRSGDVIATTGDYSAQQISYNNTTSGLAAAEVKSAIDEVANKLNYIKNKEANVAVTVAANPNTIIFSNAFLDTNYSLLINCVDSTGSWQAHQFTKNTSGFTISVSADGTVDYIAESI